MRKVLKILLFIIGGVLLLVAGVVVWLNTNSGKGFVRDQALSYLRKKLKTEVYIGELGYGLPKYIVLKNVLFKDQAKDTLLNVRLLEVDIDMLKLLHKQVDIKQIKLEGVNAHIYRNAPDTAFNFSYIINAFTGPTKSPQPKKAKDTSTLVIDLNRLVLNDIHAKFDDHTGGTRMALDLHHLDLSMKKMDMRHMQFHIKSLAVAGLNTVVLQDTSYLPVNTKNTKASILQLVADDIDLQQVIFHYNSSISKFLMDVSLGKLKTKARIFDLAHEKIDLEQLALSQSTVKIVIGKHSPVPEKVKYILDTLPQASWRVLGADVQFTGVNFALDNENKPHQPIGMDYSHLDLRNLNLNTQDLYYTADTISGNVKSLTGTDQSGLDIKELRTRFLYCGQGAILRDLYLRTPNTVLQKYIEVRYPSLDALKKRVQTLQLNLDISNSIVGVKDIIEFAPMLYKQELFRRNRNAHFQLAATIKGNLDALNIKNLYISGFGSTEIQLNGRLSGLPDAKAISYNLNIARFRSSSNDIAPILPASVTKQIRIPARFSVAGQIAGNLKDYKTNLAITSTDGNAFLMGSILTSPGKGRERYDMAVRTDRLNLGRILRKDSLMGAVTARVNVKGQSFDVKKMNAVLNGTIAAASIKGYTYKQVKFNGKVVAGIGDLTLNSADNNARLDLDAHADMTGRYIALKALLKVDSMNFQALKLYKSDLRIHGIMNIDFPVLNPDYPQGTFIWNDPVIVMDGKRYLPDSMYISSKPSVDNSQNILVHMDVLQATVTGHTPLTKIGDIITEHINRHYSFAPRDSTSNGVLKAKSKVARMLLTKDTTKITGLPANYDLKVSAHIEDRPLLHVILPGIVSMDTVHVEGLLDPNTLYLNVDVPQMIYGSNTIDNAKVRVNGADSAFTYAVTVDHYSASKMQFWYGKINGNLDKNKITANVSLSDSAKKERFALAASLLQDRDTQIIQLQPGLKLNYQTWQVAEPNRIVLATQGMYVENFRISSGNQFISANSAQPRPNTPLRVDISNLVIANIADIISKDTTLVNGILGGNIILEKTVPTAALTSSLTIQNLSVMGDTVGDLKLEINHEKENDLTAKMNITGRGNDVSLAGNYYLQPVNGNDFNFDLNMNPLALKAFEGFAMGQIRNSSGYLRGDLKITGTTSAPQINGMLTTDQLATTISSLNAYFKMPSEKLQFSSKGIQFDNFHLYDSAGNDAVLTGYVNTSNLKNISLDMQVNANNWRALHSTAGDNKVFYGDVLLTTDMHIKGTPSSPVVDGSLNILKGTKLTVVMPETVPELESSKGIVEFFSMRDTGRYNVFKTVKHKDAPKLKLGLGSEINVNMSVDKSAELTIVLDKSTGDFVNVRGDAALNAAVTPDGTLGLTGTYQLHEGTYQLNYNFIKRKFVIQDGSSITFSGDPKDSRADITAVYLANVAPYDLVQKQVTDPAQLNFYKERLPFNVELHIRGPILTPSLTFNISLPDNQVYPISYDALELVRGKLNQVRQDTTELNKQVFALLILNHFVSDDPFSSGAASSATFIAKQSVSRFIGEQLNQFASNLVKGVDLAVDLASSEDYTTGSYRERTDLNLAASKRLLNDRLKVTIGNDFELSGPQTTHGSQNSLIPSNLAADYLLTADGRYTMRAYRKNYDEGVLEGYVTETGLNFIVSLDYNKFSNIFKKTKKTNSQAAVNTSQKNAK
ncbi:MAG: translocation/assembly module TamB domain-containing protein [Taibaiella sp.]|nr:translocation/assembly module TamB domain-containing protein [Taibaiella sp.]